VTLPELLSDDVACQQWTKCRPCLVGVGVGHQTREVNQNQGNAMAGGCTQNLVHRLGQYL